MVIAIVMRRLHVFTVAGILLALSGCQDKVKDAEMSGVGPDTSDTFVFACPDPKLDTSKWQSFEGQSLSFKLPPGFTRRPGTGIDSEAVSFENGNRIVGYDFGLYSASLEGYIRDTRNSDCREIIDGREALIVSTHAIGGRYFAGASWRDVRPNIHLTISGASSDLAGQREILALVRTVRFNTSSE